MVSPAPLSASSATAMTQSSTNAVSHYSALPSTDNHNAPDSSLQMQLPPSSVSNSLNPPVSPVVLHPPIPGPSLSGAPTFSYNIPHSGSGFNGNQHFQSTMYVPPNHLPGGNNNPPSAAGSSQPPVPHQARHPSSFVPGAATMTLPLPPPPKGALLNATSFSFNGNTQLFQKEQSLKLNTSAAAAQEAGISSAPTISQSALLPAYTSQSPTMAVPSAPNLGPATSWKSMAPSFPVHHGMPGTPDTPGPPGLAPSAATEASSSAILRPTIPTTSIQTNPSVQQQMYPSYPSLPAMTSFHQGLWLQPPQMGSVPRQPYLPYSSAFPGSYPVPALAMPLPSVPLLDAQPLGVTSVGIAGSTHMSSASGHQLVGSSSAMETDVPPPGTDSSRHINDVTVNHVPSNDGAPANKLLDSWTAHKTETGVVYYYNALTGESTYKKPFGFKGEPDKVPVEPTSTSVESLAGTDWALVTTSDDKKFYYNSKTKVSSWQIPGEVTEVRKRQGDDVLKEHSMSVPNTSALTEKGSGTISLSTPALNTGGRDANALRTSGVLGSSSALDLIKKKLQDSGTPITSSPTPALSGTTAGELNGSRVVEAAVKGLQSENSKDKQKDGNMSDSSSDSEDADSGPTKDECIIQFKEMLKERGVAPFSKWEKELPKIVFDPRFKAVPSYSTRRSVFEHYVKTRAEEERKEKRAAHKAAIEGFKQLLEEASEDIDHNTDYRTFRKKWGNDPRFEALDRKDRELLLNERVIPLKRAAQEKVQVARAAAADSFKSMLRDKGDVTINSRWSKVKDSLRDDPRYKSVKHEDREVLFNEYIYELRAALEKAERETKSKREEQEKLKEREREMRKRKEREEQEMERVRIKVRRKEAVSSYQALLVETIKDPQASWTESKSKLEKDPQGRASNPGLDASDAENYFREHIKMLHERCANDFRALLGELLTAEAASQETEDGKTIFNSWSTAKRLLKPDPKYNKMPRKDRETLWRRYADEMLRKQKLTFDEKEDKHTDSKGISSGSRRRTQDRR